MGACWSRFHRAKDEFRRRHLAKVLDERGFPWCRRSGEVVGSGRHGMEETMEAEGGLGDGSYGCYGTRSVGFRL